MGKAIHIKEKLTPNKGLKGHCSTIELRAHTEIYFNTDSHPRQSMYVRYPGHTIHSGYQEYIRLVLLLSSRQLPERSDELESWTPY